MDAFTHGLASYSLLRAVFPRAARATLISALLAGMAADVDYFSEYFGPSAFLAWHRTFTHSIAGTLLLAVAFTLATMLATRNKQTKDSLRAIFLTLLAVCSLHLAMDLTQNDGVQLFWPFRAQRYSAHWVAPFDLWILMVLLAGALLPQLLGLVTEEIGAKSKSPRGRLGAIFALVVVCLYVGGRFILHGNAVATLDTRTYRGELPRRAAAFAESDSPFHWHGVVETERALHDLELDLTPGSSFNPDAATLYYKPETSAPLEAARNTETVRRFLQSAKFPKATVEKTPGGFRIEIRDLPRQRGTSAVPRVIAIVETDPNAKVVAEELGWDKAS